MEATTILTRGGTHDVIEVVLFLVADIQRDGTGRHECIDLIGGRFGDAGTGCVGELLKLFSVSHESAFWLAQVCHLTAKPSIKSTT